MVIRGKPTKEKLENIYQTIHKLINNQECYYTPEQIKKLKLNEENVFLERRAKNE